MKTLLLLLSMVLLVGGAKCEGRPAPPFTCAITLARFADPKEPKPWVIILNTIAYRDLDGLKAGLDLLPAGTVVTWEPGCLRMGGEPLVSPEETAELTRYCAARGLVLKIIPAG